MNIDPKEQLKWLTGPVVVALAALGVLAVALTLAALLVVVLGAPDIARDVARGAVAALSRSF